jgi:hypothetical protein
MINAQVAMFNEWSMQQWLNISNHLNISTIEHSLTLEHCQLSIITGVIL